MKNTKILLSFLFTALFALSACGSASSVSESVSDEPKVIVTEFTTQAKEDTSATDVTFTEEAPVLPENGTSEDVSADEAANGENSTSEENVPKTPDFVFSAYDLVNAKNISEEAFYDYKVTMLNFWEPWCGPCISEMPDLERIFEEYGSGTGDFNIIGCFSTTEGASDILNYCCITYPSIEYCEEFDPLQTGYVPTTVFFDSNGHIIPSDLSDADGYSFIGSRDYENWQIIIEEMLSACE